MIARTKDAPSTAAMAAAKRRWVWLPSFHARASAPAAATLAIAP